MDSGKINSPLLAVPPAERPYPSAAPEGSRDRTSDPLETHQGNERSITPIATIPKTITTASATTAVKATTSETAGMGYSWLGFIHHEPPPIVILFVESLDRCVSLGVRVHLDEAKTLAASRGTVEDDLGALNGAERGEPLLQIR
jgi:hypothetical protein